MGAKAKEESGPVEAPTAGSSAPRPAADSEGRPRAKRRPKVGTAVSAYLPFEALKRLYELAEERGTTVSAIIREAVSFYLKQVGGNRGGEEKDGGREASRGAD